MFTRSVMFYIIVLAVLLCTYVGYQLYESRVEIDELISSPNAIHSKTDAIQSKVDEGAEPPDRAGLRNSSPKASSVDETPQKPVTTGMAYRQTPDGKMIPFRIPEGMEYSETLIFPPGSITGDVGDIMKPKPDFVRFYTTDNTPVRFHRDDIPEGETSQTYGMKLSIAQEKGVSIEEVEKMMANGEIIVTDLEVVKFPEFSEYRKHLESLGIDAETIAEIERRSKLLPEGEPPPQIENGVFPPPVESNGEEGPHQKQAVEMLSDDFDTARDKSTSPKETLSPPKTIPKASPKSESDWEKLLSQFGDDFAQGLDKDRLRWVAETLNRYGVEKGIRRIEARDKQLAQRLRRNLEKRDGRNSPRSTKPPSSENRK